MLKFEMLILNNHLRFQSSINLQIPRELINVKNFLVSSIKMPSCVSKFYYYMSLSLSYHEIGRLIKNVINNFIFLIFSSK